MVKILAVTEYYNEVANIPGLVENMANQSYRPDLWLIIDDGSSDNSTEVFEKKLREFGFQYILHTMPAKPKPSQNLKGRAFQEIDMLNSDWVDTADYDYLLLTGADSRFPKYYTEIGVRVLDKFPEIGTMAGRNKGEPGSDTPMGGGKIVKWDVVKATRGRYWDLDPDSLWNIIALKLGYKMLIIRDLKMWVTRPTHMYAPSGFYNYGERMYYVGWNIIHALIYTMVLAARKTHPHHFLRGYLHTMIEGSWKLKDKEIQEFYGFKRIIQRLLKLVPMQDKAVIVDVGAKEYSEEGLTDQFMMNTFEIIRKFLK